MIRTIVALAGSIFIAAPTLAQGDPSPDGSWLSLGDFSDQTKAGVPWVRPAAYRAFRADLPAIAATLSQAPLRGTPAAQNPLTIWVPTPDGGFARFAIVESPVMEPALQAKFPDIRSYIGQGIDDPSTNIALDLSPLGIRAQVLAPDGQSWSIDPFTRDRWTEYACYEIRNLVRTEPWHCHVSEDLENLPVRPYADRATGQTLRTYRLAVAAVPSYTNFYGGTVTGAMSGINTTITRLSQVYTNEFACTFTLVANNDLLIYTNANPGPYTDGDLGSMIDQNQSNLNAVIGSANYNIGHVFSAQNLGGLAQLRALCNSTGKARGGTGLSNPTGDFFSVEYVGHEVGHQFGASHSFNADDSAAGNVCTPNRSASNAYEPGAGTTIMSYSGLCGSNNNIQNASDPMFNQGAYAQVAAHITGTGNCGTNTSTGNTAPTVNAGPDLSIPILTPFDITATASDPNNDALTFSWEERDLGPAQVLTGTGSADNGTSPLFRVWPPASSPTRFFPRATSVLTNSLTAGEQYPALARTLRLRVTARDNRAGGGGVNTDDVNLTVVASAGPFRVTSPNSGVIWAAGSSQTITWDVANTTASPISAANVNILLSLDNGNNFTITLASNTPNDGSHTIVVPNVVASQARIRVEPTNNVFYDVSDTGFTITCTPPNFPTGLVASDDRCDAVLLSWNPTPGATSYDVYRNTTSSTSGATFLANTASTSFSDPSAPAHTTFFYRIKALSGGCASPFSGADAGVRGFAPTIIAQPASVFVSLGQSASFSVAAAGEPLAYAWRKNGAPLSNGPRISGVASPNLSISNVEAADEGSYDVVLSSPCGNATSNAAILSLQIACIADVDDGSGSGTPDGGITIDDLLFYLFIFEAGDLRSDVDDGSFSGTFDGGVTIDDLLYFLFRFESGC